MKRLLFYIFTSILAVNSASGQEAAYGAGYQFMIMRNPAYSGAERSGNLRLSYLNFYPGNHYGMNSFYMSWDSYVSALHGGAGVWAANDYLGSVIRDLRGGLSYSYFLQAGKDLYVNAGLSASFFNRGYSFAHAVLSDQIDQLGRVTLPSAEIFDSRGKTVFDIGTGLLLIYKDFSAGISIDHLSQPSISRGSEDRLMRKFGFNAAYRVRISSDGNIYADPVLFADFQGDYLQVAAGAVIENDFLSLSALLEQENTGNTNVQSGLSLNAGTFIFFYNYRFNVISTVRMMPFSLLHQAGFMISLNNVDKRKAAGTTSFPKM